MQNVIANNGKGTLIQCDLESQLHFEFCFFLPPEYSYFCVLIAIQLLPTKKNWKNGFKQNREYQRIENSQDNKLMRNLRWWYRDTPQNLVSRKSQNSGTTRHQHKKHFTGMNNTVWLSPVYFNPQIVQEINFIICQVSTQSWRAEIG